ncbi:alpha/beta fold hydrolase [Paenibacillus tengchongensis]|uniref:alpha/beta fold hydrolase n=1 Tax=Paenibacillus tengchongensis TaxID=2608684 RepID=UPI00165283BD|nr:alpha/beta fold hydrolase [Paenibacillus tengchongensis]
MKIHYEYEPALHGGPHTETLLLIHGIGFDLRCWDRIVPAMLEHYHVLRYDFRGHGFSEKGAEELHHPAAAMVGDIHALLEHLQIANVHLIGHGAGSILALYFSRAYPRRAETTVLLSLPLYHSAETANKYSTYRQDLMKQHSMRALAEHVLGNATLFKPGSAEMEALHASFARVPLDVYTELLIFFNSAHSEIMDMFKQHQVPALILTGEHDPMYPPYLSSLIASSNPLCRYRMIYNSSNMVFYDQPEETFQQIKAFIDTRSQTQQSLDPLLHQLHADFFTILNSNPVAHGQTGSPLLKVQLLNRFEVTVGELPVNSGWGRRNARELLIYLLLNPSADRDRLCGELWSDMDILKARGQLRVCLTHLKQLLNNEETGLIYSDKQQIKLQSEAECDLLRLLADIRKANEEKDVDSKMALIDSVFWQIEGDIFCNLDQDWNMNLRYKTEIELIALANYQAEVLASRHNIPGAIAYLKYVLLFNEEEFGVYEQIANLYERNGQSLEAQKWRSEAEKRQRSLAGEGRARRR